MSYHTCPLIHLVCWQPSREPSYLYINIVSFAYVYIILVNYSDLCEQQSWECVTCRCWGYSCFLLLSPWDKNVLLLVACLSQLSLNSITPMSGCVYVCCRLLSQQSRMSKKACSWSPHTPHRCSLSLDRSRKSLFSFVWLQISKT